MNSTGKRMSEERRELISAALLIAPAVALGVLAMILHGLSPALWGQQIAAWAAFALLAWPAKRAAARISARVWSVLLLLFLAASLMGQEAGGARRWVNLGIVHANAAHLVLPALLTVLCRVKNPLPALLGAAAILSFQPDLMQMTAFLAASAPLLRRLEDKQLWGSILILGLLAVRCLNAPTALEPLSYCEGILDILAQTLPLLKTIGWVALAAVPVILLIGFAEEGERRLLSVAIYYAVSILFAASGESPVLFMGFGLSPIAGYYLAYVCHGAAERPDISAA